MDDSTFKKITLAEFLRLSKEDDVDAHPARLTLEQWRKVTDALAEHAKHTASATHPSWFYLIIAALIVIAPITFGYFCGRYSESDERRTAAINQGKLEGINEWARFMRTGKIELDPKTRITSAVEELIQGAKTEEQKKKVAKSLEAALRKLGGPTSPAPQPATSVAPPQLATPVATPPSATPVATPQATTPAPTPPNP